MSPVIVTSALMLSMRHTISTFLLCTLLLQYVGWVVVFQVVRKQARREVRARIMSGVPANELHAFVMFEEQIGVDADGRTWEHDGEFEYNDVMYDVVRVEVSADKVVVLAVADLKESALYQRIALEAKQQTPATAKHSSLIKLASQILGQPFLRPSLIVHRLTGVDCRPLKHRERIVHAVRRSSDVESPPPEGAVAIV